MAAALKNFVNDFEILGVGGQRQQALLALPKPVVLCCHSKLLPSDRLPFYEVIVAETLEWLRPASRMEIEFPETPKEKLAELLAADFSKHFPETEKKLGPKTAGILERYNEALPWQGPLLSDHFRYFSGFLREEGEGIDASLIAQKEWIISYLGFNDFGRVRSEAGHLQLNPSLQTLAVEESISGMKDGLYLFYQHPITQEVCESLLDASDAELLDLLHEERKFSREQLLSFVHDESDSSADWAKKLSNLISRGIILNN